jgi:uncharacterized protein (UPF0332 family)
MEPVEFLQAATELLVKQPIKEVDCRNAASRAYYCAFHLCKRLLEQYPPAEPQRGTEHQKIINELKQHQNKQFRPLGNVLTSLWRLRVKADYKLVEKFAIQDARIVIGATNKLLQEIDAIKVK